MNMRLFIAILTLCFALPSVAQTFPSRPIRIIVPSTAGGAADLLARLLAQHMATSLGQPVIVDNRPGAGNIIGTDAVAKASPDGHTLLLAINNHAINASLYKKLPYDPIKDFAAVSLLASTPHMLLVHPSLGIKSVTDFIALARAQPGKLNYASAGNGSASHLSAELVKEAFGIDWVHVPYRGSGPAMTDLMAGQVTMSVPGLSSTVSQVKSGALKALAVTGATRSPQLPNVPTLSEMKPGLVLETWVGISAPPKTPPQIIAKLASLIEQAMKDPELQAQLFAQGVTPVYEKPSEITARMVREVGMFTALGKRTQISMD